MKVVIPEFVIRKILELRDNGLKSEMFHIYMYKDNWHLSYVDGQYEYREIILDVPDSTSMHGCTVTFDNGNIGVIFTLQVLYGNPLRTMMINR